MPYTEACDIAKRLKWDPDHPIPKNEVIVEAINEWPMEKILQRLTGKQFAQFCRENDVALKGVKHD